MLLSAFVLLAQVTATPATSSVPQFQSMEKPLVEIDAHVKARSMTIEKRGDAHLALTNNDKNVVDIQAPKANGRGTIPNPRVDVHVELYVADPNVASTSPSQPQ